MKSLSKSDKIKTLIAPKMIDLITLFDNNGISAVYTGEDIHGIYRYLEMIGSTTTLNNSSQCSHHFGTSSFTNNDTATLQLFFSDLHMRQKIICK